MSDLHIDPEVCLFVYDALVLFVPKIEEKIEEPYMNASKCYKYEAKLQEFHDIY